jgi:type 1 glutamine amidotransferase
MRESRSLLSCVVLLVWTMSWSHGDSSATRLAADPPALRLLLVTATSGFHHDSVATARSVVPAIGVSSGAFVTTIVAEVADLGQINAQTLSHHDVVMFANTSGNLPLSDAQKAALDQFVTSGGGFIGTHSATDTLYDWPQYGEMIDAYFSEHPWTREATVKVEDRSHPATEGLGESFDIREEFYVFRDNPRPRVHVLLSLDAASVGASGDYPLAWCSLYGAGRVYYNALGHVESTWEDVRFQQQILGAIRWTGGRTPTSGCDSAPATLTPTAAPTATPTPMPIGCSARPRVSLDVSRPRSGALDVVIAANDNDILIGNRLQRVAFSRITNGSVTIGSLADRRSPFVAALSPAVRATRFTVDRIDALRPIHVDLVVTDGCGNWPTFVGGGPSAL